MLFPKNLALIIFFTPLVHLEVSPSDDKKIKKFGCDCDYKKSGLGGCVISRAARPGRACKCYQAYLDNICWGQVVKCFYPMLPSCKSGSDMSLSACLQGGGNCLGYSEIDD